MYGSQSTHIFHQFCVLATFYKTEKKELLVLSIVRSYTLRMEAIRSC